MNGWEGMRGEIQMTENLNEIMNFRVAGGQFHVCIAKRQQFTDFFDASGCIREPFFPDSHVNQLVQER
jgi:hypothetical protein